ncbi:Uncharacterised protein [Mycobacteroides abscessus subsp. bolletii]|nr:Uncharacterised protein [Mycobacteroides abscessus subsp. bolletii]
MDRGRGGGCRGRVGLLSALEEIGHVDARNPQTLNYFRHGLRTYPEEGAQRVLGIARAADDGQIFDLTDRFRGGLGGLHHRIEDVRQSE